MAHLNINREKEKNKKEHILLRFLLKYRSSKSSSHSFSVSPFASVCEPQIFSPPSPPPLLVFCGQQAFSLLSVESAKHSHFWTADRLELADSMERLLRKRDIKDGRERGAKQEKLLMVKKNTKTMRCLFSS